MQTPLNAVQQAFWDTLVHKAEGDQFDNLTAFYGFPRYRSWDLASWRQALHAVAHGPRGISQNVFGMLRGIFKTGEKQNFGKITNASNVKIIKDTSGGDAKFGTSVWTDKMEGRWIEIKARTSKASQYVDGNASEVPEGIYQVTNKTVGGGTINLAPIATSCWKEPKFQTLQYEHRVHVNVLPFKIRERVSGPLGATNADIPKSYGTVGNDGELTAIGDPCVTEIVIYDEDIDAIKPPPGTYMQDGVTGAGDTTPAGARYFNIDTGAFVAAPNTPLGGQIQLNAFEAGDSIVGPHPIYFISEDGTMIPYGLAEIFNLILPAGCKFKFVNAVEGEV